MLASELTAGNSEVAAGGEQPYHNTDLGGQAAQPRQVTPWFQPPVLMRICPMDSASICLLTSQYLGNTYRPKDEVLEKPLSRIQKSVAPPQGRGCPWSKERKKLLRKQGVAEPANYVPCMVTAGLSGALLA